MAILTIDELRSFAAAAVDRVEHLGDFLKIEERREEMARLNEKMAAPDFWDHKEDAQNTVAALSAAKNVIDPYEKVQKEAGELDVLIAHLSHLPQSILKIRARDIPQTVHLQTVFHFFHSIFLLFCFLF